MKRRLPTVLLGLVFVIGGVAYTSKLVPPAIFGEPDPIRLSGVMVATKVIVSTKILGRLNVLNVREGQWVTAGQEIARLDDAELKARRDAFVAQLAQLRGKLRELEEAVQLEREQTAEQLLRAGSQLEAARSQAEQARAELEQRQADEKRVRELRTQNLAAQQEAERTVTEVRVKQASLKALQQP